MRLAPHSTTGNRREPPPPASDSASDPESQKRSDPAQWRELRSVFDKADARGRLAAEGDELVQRPFLRAQLELTVLVVAAGVADGNGVRGGRDHQFVDLPELERATDGVKTCAPESAATIRVEQVVDALAICRGVVLPERLE